MLNYPSVAKAGTWCDPLPHRAGVSAMVVFPFTAAIDITQDQSIVFATPHCLTAVGRCKGLWRDHLGRSSIGYELGIEKR